MTEARYAKDDFAVETWRTSVYHTLDPQRKQIRVLRVLPDPDIQNDPRGEFFVLDLDDTASFHTPKLASGRLYDSSMRPGTFAALSYCWGDQTKWRDMWLHGQRIKIGKSAHEALRYLRNAKQSINVWVDAICIDQRNEDREKSHQITLMKDLYSLACPVYIWTGRGKKYSYRALGVICQMAETMAQTQPPQPDPRHVAKKRAVWKRMQDVTNSDWLHVFKFLQKPVWRRVWVQQEMILSSPGRKVGLIVAGTCQINHYVFISGIRAVGEAFAMFGGPQFRLLKALQPSVMAQAATSARELSLIYNTWSVCETIPEMYLFSILQGLEATKPVDYVYGLLGLLPYLAPRPSYDKPLNLVYTEAMAAILVRHGSLAPILAISHHWRFPNSGVPSWVMDWRERTDKNHQQRWAELATEYNACLDFQFGDITVEGLCLGVQARVVFILQETHLGPPTEFNYQVKQPPVAQRAFLYQMLQLSGTHDLDAGSPAGEALERALLLDLEIDAVRRLGDDYSTQSTQATQVALSVIRGEITGPVFDHEASDAVFQSLCDRLRNTRIGVSPEQQICILPVKTEPGDAVCIAAGSSIPIVLRRAGRLTEYSIVGGAYVHGIMDGEALREGSIDDLKRVNRQEALFENIWLV